MTRLRCRNDLVNIYEEEAQHNTHKKTQTNKQTMRVAIAVEVPITNSEARAQLYNNTKVLDIIFGEN